MWDWAIWAALIAGGACVLGALAYGALRVLQGWRDFKLARRHVFDAVDVLTARAAVVADSAARAADTSETMESAARLRRSLARLAVLREAVDEAQETLGRFTAVVSRR